jgi:hypothetical protein
MTGALKIPESANGTRLEYDLNPEEVWVREQFALGSYRRRRKLGAGLLLGL